MTKTVAVGSGRRWHGGKGDADVLLVHSPEDEEEFMDGGHGSRDAVMHNDFVIVGPPETREGRRGPRRRGCADPDRRAGGTVRVARRRFRTHNKELGLWEEAGVEPSGYWYFETGQGMGETLTIAGQKSAYTLTDRGTYLATEGLSSTIAFEDSPPAEPLPRDRRRHGGATSGLRGGVLAVDPVRPVRGQIGEFGVEEYGEPLFFPTRRAET